MLTDSLKSTRDYWDFMLCWNQHASKSLLWDTRDSSYLCVVQECKRKHAPGKWYEQVWKKSLRNCCALPSHQISSACEQQETWVWPISLHKKNQCYKKQEGKIIRWKEKTQQKVSEGKEERHKRKEEEKRKSNFWTFCSEFLVIFACSMFTLSLEREEDLEKYGITGFTVSTTKGENTELSTALLGRRAEGKVFLKAASHYLWAVPWHIQ